MMTLWPTYAQNFRNRWEATMQLVIRKPFTYAQVPIHGQRTLTHYQWSSHFHWLWPSSI
jgi:hypothetical protein